jgi:protein-tyrosine-phosphatase
VRPQRRAVADGCESASSRGCGTGSCSVGGLNPSEEIHANVREAMAEIGLDLAQEFPQPLTDEVVRAADVVITMGCGDACPVYPGKRYLDWELPDPRGQAAGDSKRNPRRLGPTDLCTLARDP